MSVRTKKLLNLAVFGALLAAVCWAGWMVAHGTYYKSGTGLGYALGLAGGLMLLTLLLYPLRKRAGFMQRLGQLKYWFRMHMILGVLAPTFILFHTTFRVGSINATVALYCMLLVAVSGLIGRFVYRGIHMGLYGKRTTLEEVRAELMGNTGNVMAHLHFFPQVAKRIEDYEHRALDAKRGLLAGIAHFLTFDFRRMLLAGRCMWEIRRVSRRLHMTDAADEAVQLVPQYLLQVQRVAQFKKCEQIFSAWHVLHIPLVYMMVGTAIFHVIWVHMY